MLRLLRNLGCWLALTGCAYSVAAFTLLGPRTTWQTDVLQYDVNQPIPGFGPMNLGEEYRWNVPTVYYGFTSDFMNYFGQRGVQEIEKAIGIINNLTNVSLLNVNDFPTGSLRINHRAQALGLTDLKSFALQVMLYEMGLGDPTRYVYCIRNRWIPPGGCPPILYHVIKRNFDPNFTGDFTLHSSYINGDLWTYTTILDGCDVNEATLFPEPVDPMALLGFRHAPVTSLQAGFLYGGFFTTLTRDDIGALKYIYRPNNYNVENLAPGATNSLTGSSGSPWGVPPWLLTNGYVTNIVGGTNALLEPALRGGVDKVTFTRVDFDSVMGSFFTSVTNNYTEQLIVNGSTLSRDIVRILQVPDILFDAADLQGDETQDTITIASYGTLAWDNNDDINGVALQAGPGTIVPATGTTPALILTLNSVGPIWGNAWPFYLSEADAVQPNQWLLWGSFDGTTNAPVVYPIGTSIDAVETLVLGEGD